MEGPCECRAMRRATTWGCTGWMLGAARPLASLCESCAHALAQGRAHRSHPHETMSRQVPQACGPRTGG